MIVVTGALGFIGSRVLEALSPNDPEAQLLAVDHPIAEAKKLNQIDSVRFVDHETFLSELKSRNLRPEVIIHMGACSSTTETDWNYLKNNNLEYSKSLWNWCAQNGARLIYASSAATYGDGSNGFDDDTDIAKLEPLNLYGRSKHEFDLWVQEQNQIASEFPAQCVGFKFFNVFGPGEAHKGRMASMVFHGYNQIQSTGCVRLFKSHRSDFVDGGQLRDFIYVDQVVALILQCLAEPNISGLFNLGTGKARSFRDLIEATFHALGREPNIEYIPMPDDLRERYQYFTQATMAKATRSGLMLPGLSLEDAVEDYVVNLLKASKG